MSRGEMHARSFDITHLTLTYFSIQQSAALALGRLANYSDDLAEAVVQNEILPQLVSNNHGINGKARFDSPPSSLPGLLSC